MSKKMNDSDKRIIKNVSAAEQIDKSDCDDAQKTTLERLKITKRIAVMLGIVILILIVIILLFRGCQGEGHPHGSIDIPGNVIDPEPPVIIPEADLDFNNANAEENVPFDVEGMAGGSIESICYRVVATYNSDFVLKYDMTIREDEEFQKLAEILKIKVALVGAEGDTLLYDDLLSDMSVLEIEMKADADTTTEVLFRITIYLDAPLDEQYYGQKLIADMSWWIDGQDNIAIANCEFTTVFKVIPPDPPNPPDPPVITPDFNFVQLNEGDNTAFDMKDIENEDSATKYFAFEIAHGEDITVLLENAVVLDSALGNVLKVKVEIVEEDGNVTLYEGLLKDLSVEHRIPWNNEGKTTVYYKVTVNADGLTEPYCETKLVCDLSWSLVGTNEQLKVPSNSFVAYDKPYTPPTPPETATSIELTAGEGYDNIPFAVENMLPGGSYAQYYCISVTHDSPETIRFGIAVDTIQKLAEVLRVRVEQLIPDATDMVLYDGLMEDCTSVDIDVEADTETISQVYYRVTVYTNGAEVGNEYAGASLSADFSWQLQ